MAGTIIADTIQAGGSFIRLNNASQTVATINASGLYSNTGNLIISSSGTIVNNTAISGTMTQSQIGTGVAGTGPAFSAYLSGNQTLTNATATKLAFNTEYYDTASCFDSSTNYRFTPNVAGYYLITGQFSQWLPGSPSFLSYFYIYKNGSSYRYVASAGTGGNAVNSTISEVVYLNGSTDYVELYGYVNAYSGSSGTNGASGGTLACQFGACLMRAA